VHDLGVVVNTAQHQVQLVGRLEAAARAANVRERHQRRLAERQLQIDGELLLQ